MATTTTTTPPTDSDLPTVYAAVADLDTTTLVGICYRITPHHDRSHWRVTSGTGAWLRDQASGQFVLWHQGTMIDARSEDRMRRDAMEQLAYYKITRTQINEMRS